MFCVSVLIMGIGIIGSRWSVNEHTADFLAFANMEALARGESGSGITCWRTVSMNGAGRPAHYTYCGSCDAVLARRLLIKIIVLVDFKGCQIFLITPSFINISMKSVLSVFGCGAGHKLAHKEFYSFTNEKNLEMISVKIDEILLADFMIKKGDYLFMISTRSDSMVYLYALPDFAVL